MYSGDIWSHYPCCVVVTSDDFINKKPELLRKFLKVHVESTDYVNTHKGETAEILSEKLGVTFKIEEDALIHVEFVAVPTDEFKTNTLKIVDIQKQIGYINKNVTITQNDIFDLDYLPS